MSRAAWFGVAAVVLVLYFGLWFAWPPVLRWIARRRSRVVRYAEGMITEAEKASAWAKYRRDPCEPGGCLLTETMCLTCARRLYECEKRRGYAVAVPTCAACHPFIHGHQYPEGWDGERCTHGRLLYQRCETCAALPINQPDECEGAP